MMTTIRHIHGCIFMTLICFIERFHWSFFMKGCTAKLHLNTAETKDPERAHLVLSYIIYLKGLSSPKRPIMFCVLLKGWRARICLVDSERKKKSHLGRNISHSKHGRSNLCRRCVNCIVLLFVFFPEFTHNNSVRICTATVFFLSIGDKTTNQWMCWARKKMYFSSLLCVCSVKVPL